MTPARPYWRDDASGDASNAAGLVVGGPGGGAGVGRDHDTDASARADKRRRDRVFGGGGPGGGPSPEPARVARAKEAPPRPDFRRGGPWRTCGSWPAPPVR